MTYREEIGRLTGALRHLLVDGAIVPTADLPAAVAGHASLIAMLAAVHAELTDGTPPPRGQDVADLDRRPVALLGKLLKQQPSINDLPFSDVLQLPVDSPAGKLWREVAISATLAQYEWQRSMPSQRPTGDAAWSEIADVSYLAESAAVLSGDIADSLAHAGRPQHASEFRRASNSGLRAAARTVQQLAEAGHLPKTADLQEVSSTRIFVTSIPAELPEAFERLHAIIRAATDIPPAQVAAVSRVIAEAATSAAAALESTGDRAAARMLKEHAAKHAQIPGLDRNVVALAAGNGKTAVQAQVIHDVFRRMERKQERLHPDVAHAVATSIPELTQELAAAAERQLATARWLVPARGGQELRWAPVRAPADRPKLVSALRSAETHAKTLDDALTANLPLIRRPDAVPRLALGSPLKEHPANARPQRLTPTQPANPPRTR